MKLNKAQAGLVALIILIGNVIILGFSYATYSVESRLNNIEQHEHIDVLAIVFNKKNDKSMFFRRRVKLKYGVFNKEYIVAKRISESDWINTEVNSIVRLKCLKSNYRNFKILGFDSYSFEFSKFFFIISLILPIISIVYIYFIVKRL